MSAASANFGIGLLDVRFTLVEQPLSQMVVNFVNPLLQFVGRDIVIGLGTRRSLNLVQGPLARASERSAMRRTNR